ncbi:MAG: DMT family transporter, partial [Oscillospiraceae bacterium]|nr:DMT family transporter [Oscillospiraceae bacterium]
MVSKGVLENAAAMAIYGTISLAVRNIALSSGETAFWRVAIALAAILIYKCAKRERLPFRQAKSELPWLAASGVALGGDWILFFEAYRYTSVSLTTLSYYFCPVIVMVLSPVIFKERITFRQWVCFVMASFGLVLIIGARARGSERELIGIALGLAAAVCYAGIILINKRIRAMSGIDRTAFQFMAAAAVLAIYVSLTS